MLLHVRESWEVTVSRLEPDELCEERKRLVGGAHGNGAREGADDRDDAKYEVKYGHSPTEPPAQGGLGGLKKAILVTRVYIHMAVCVQCIWIRSLWCSFRLVPTLQPPWRQIALFPA